MSRLLARIVTAAGVFRSALRRPTLRTSPDVIHRVVWNAREGRNPQTVISELDAWLAGRFPHMITLMEAAGYTKAVRRRYRGTYRVFVRYGWPESRNIVTLVRRDVYVPRWSTIRMKIGWIGPKAFRRHAGRTQQVIDIGRGHASQIPLWRFAIVHRVPGGPDGGTVTHGRNQPAYAEEHEALLKLGRRKGSRRRAFICDGDQNAEIRDGHPISPSTLADELDADLVPTGAKVDWAFARGCTGEGKAFRDVGGDHPLIKYRYEHNLRRNP